VNADRHVGAWVGAGLLTVLTLALLIPSGWYAVAALPAGGADWHVSHADHLTALHTLVLLACCPAIGALLMMLVSQLARESVPFAHQVLVMVAGVFVAAVLLTTGEVLSYVNQYIPLGQAGPRGPGRCLTPGGG
jgi:hypothetical protein